MATVARTTDRPDPHPDVIRVCDRCFRPMRECTVDPRITALICDHCGERQWLVNGDYASTEEALACALASDYPGCLIVKVRG